MKKVFFIFVFLVLVPRCFSSGFDLFEEKKSRNEALYTNLNHHKLHCSISLYNDKHYGRNISLGYEYFINAKIAPFIEFSSELESDKTFKKEEFLINDSTTAWLNVPIFLGNKNLKDRSELNLGVTYRLTHRYRTWIAFASTGVSLNNSLHDNKFKNRGFGVNHFFFRASLAYAFFNGIGLEYSFMLKLPIVSNAFEPNNEIHALSITYEF